MGIETLEYFSKVILLSSDILDIYHKLLVLELGHQSGEIYQNLVQQLKALHEEYEAYFSEIERKHYKEMRAFLASVGNDKNTEKGEFLFSNLTDTMKVEQRCFQYLSYFHHFSKRFTSLEATQFKVQFLLKLDIYTAAFFFLEEEITNLRASLFKNILLQKKYQLLYYLPHLESSFVEGKLDEIALSSSMNVRKLGLPLEQYQSEIDRIANSFLPNHFHVLTSFYNQTFRRDYDRGLIYMESFLFRGGAVFVNEDRLDVFRNRLLLLKNNGWFSKGKNYVYLFLDSMLSKTEMDKQKIKKGLF